MIDDFINDFLPAGEAGGKIIHNEIAQPFIMICHRPASLNESAPTNFLDFFFSLLGATNWP